MSASRKNWRVCEDFRSSFRFVLFLLSRRRCVFTRHQLLLQELSSSSASSSSASRSKRFSSRLTLKFYIGNIYNLPTPYQQIVGAYYTSSSSSVHSRLCSVEDFPENSWSCEYSLFFFHFLLSLGSIATVPLSQQQDIVSFSNIICKKSLTLFYWLREVANTTYKELNIENHLNWNCFYQATEF